MYHPTLSKLWLVAVEEGKKRGKDPRHVFHPIGLSLCNPLAWGGYVSTPPQTLSFASTGGGGTHFSFVLRNQQLSSSSPIVMTVPDNCSGKDDNVILGASLKEFLCLGFYRGYFPLEQMVFKRQDAVRFYSTYKTGYQLPDEDKELLRVLVTKLRLVPWIDVRSRLLELHDRYWTELPEPSEDEYAKHHQKRYFKLSR